MKFFLLSPAYDKDGDTIFRSVGVIPKDSKKLVAWHGRHQQGRQEAKNSFEHLRYHWRDPKIKIIADYPSGSSGDVFSSKAITILHEMLEANGDIHPLVFEEIDVSYSLFDCWSFVGAKTNEDYNWFRDGSLKTLTVENSEDLPDVFVVKKPKTIPGLIVSERFKTAAEQAGLTGMVFTEIEIIQESK